MSFTLNRKVFIPDVSASLASAWYPVDYVHYGIQQRSISGTKVSADIVQVQLRTTATADNGNIYQVISTATVYDVNTTGNFSCVIQGPFTEIRVLKVNANGNCTAVGLV